MSNTVLTKKIKGKAKYQVGWLTLADTQLIYLANWAGHKPESYPWPKPSVF